MKEMCSLAYDSAIQTISNTEKVYYKRGVWNKYELIDTDVAISKIKQSGYGADVYYNEENGMYYVSCPVSSDMW